ncbi:MAG TPA: Crp/Fnr family transcriptional regulator [Anaerolineae bacterium]|nr:Crp/Fnr family transcriptional regulator [Anaerolineae bacterium]
MTALRNFLKQAPLFSGLSDAEIDASAKDFVPNRFRQGETIFHQGDAGQLLYLIEAGQVRIFVLGEEGQETSVVLYGAGDIFGELAVIDGLPRSAGAVAMEETIVLTLNRDRFREQLRRTPQLALNFMKALSVRVRYSTQQLGSLAVLDVPGRLARKLLELAQTYGVAEPEGVRIAMALTQTDLASLIGATRESINKALAAFRRQGYILLRRHQVTIVDPDALREIGS